MSGMFSTPIKEPFDPSSLKVEVRNTTVGELCEMLRNGLIDLHPGSQQQMNLWDDKKKSSLIELIILGIPLPSFYFYIDTNKKEWIVIDGLQRLCSLDDFIVKENFTLQNLNLIKNTYEGKKYNDFTYFERLELNMRPVTLNVISGNVFNEAKNAIFNAINFKWNE